MSYGNNEDAGDLRAQHAADASAARWEEAHDEALALVNSLDIDPGYRSILIDALTDALVDDPDCDAEEIALEEQEEIRAERAAERRELETEGDIDFADPGGRSALRAATADNPRNLPCPTCGEPNRLTPADRARGYHCDACANAMERGGP